MVFPADIHGSTHAPGGIDPVSVWDMWPIGGVMMYDGDLDDVPANWSVIATDRVPIGAGATYAAGDTGGSATKAAMSHLISGSSTQILAHAGFTGSLSHSGTAVGNHAAHRHPTKQGIGTQSGSSFNSWDATVPNNETADNSSTLTHSVTQPNDHSLTGPSAHTANAPDDHASFSLLPPYYAVYLLKRMS